jgi:hypothetical protein
MSNALKMPMAGYRSFNIAALYSQGSNGSYWSTSPNGVSGYYVNFNSTVITPSGFNARATGYSVRCFKNTPYTNNDGTTTTYLADNTDSANRFTLS